jgi:hypothetical protein
MNLVYYTLIDKMQATLDHNFNPNNWVIDDFLISYRHEPTRRIVQMSLVDDLIHIGLVGYELNRAEEGGRNYRLFPIDKNARYSLHLHDPDEIAQKTRELLLSEPSPDERWHRHTWAGSREE